MKDRIKQAFESIITTMLQMIHDNFRYRIQLCINENQHVFEHLQVVQALNIRGKKTHAKHLKR